MYSLDDNDLRIYYSRAIALLDNKLIYTGATVEGGHIGYKTFENNEYVSRSLNLHEHLDDVIMPPFRPQFILGPEDELRLMNTNPIKQWKRILNPNAIRVSMFNGVNTISTSLSDLPKDVALKFMERYLNTPNSEVTAKANGARVINNTMAYSPLSASSSLLGLMWYNHLIGTQKEDALLISRAVKPLIENQVASGLLKINDDVQISYK